MPQDYIAAARPDGDLTGKRILYSAHARQPLRVEGRARGLRARARQAAATPAPSWSSSTGTLPDMEPIWKVINHTTWRARFDDMIRRDGNQHDALAGAPGGDGRGMERRRLPARHVPAHRPLPHGAELVRDADYLVTPTLSRTALPIDQDLFEPIEIDGVEVGELRRNWFPYTMPFNITGHPALTLCCGFVSDGLPIGLQIVGRFRDEASVLRAAALYEASEDWLARWPDL